MGNIIFFLLLAVFCVVLVIAVPFCFDFHGIDFVAVVIISAIALFSAWMAFVGIREYRAEKKRLK